MNRTGSRPSLLRRRPAPLDVSGTVRIVALALVLAAAAAAPGAAVAARPGMPQQLDLLILGGRVIDGTGNPWVRADVGVRGDEIVAVGDLRSTPARRTIDASGLYVVPGFIDLHSHAGGALAADDLRRRRAESLVTQGLTTIVGGADGRTMAWPLTEEIARYQEAGIGLNVVLMAGHNTIRRVALGDDFRRQATPAEIERMRGMLREAMQLGAFGMGAGLEYDPGRYSSKEEVVELARVLAEHDGFYIAHQRSEASMPLWQRPSLVDGWPIDGLQALEETIDIARRTGIRVVASHHKSRGRASFGRSQHDIALIDRARAEGLQVYLDVYPYETYGGGPRPMLPAWALHHPPDPAADPVPRFPEDPEVRRANLRRNWSDPQTRALIERDIDWEVDHNGGPERVLVLDYPDRSFVGENLAALAARHGIGVAELVVELALNGDPEVPWGAITRGHGIHDDDVDNYYRQEYTATSSDASASNLDADVRPGTHPRPFGAFVRKIARYVKDKGVVSLPFAVRSMTSLPAQIIGLTDRGLVREGFKADLVVFDYERLRDRATVLEPDRPSEGIEYVLTNGVVAVDGGRVTGELAGTVLRKR